MSRLLILTTASTLLASCVVGSATSLGGLASSHLGAGGAVVTGCDADGITTSYTTSAGRVTAVTVGGLADPGCEGGVLSLTLAGAGNASIGASGPTTIPADSGTFDSSMAMTIAAQPDAVAVTGVHIIIEGP